ncbi:hypothetical protein OH76DRAFT_1399718 [Lentinus brumalis]|uniref:Uncharacterized protein n=1 Tax=Lentinus brumalis TaxID=2498619 RepID=A0A371DKS0_9APHY|nr:hypothetical protein OH76DRAFT_1399718 [Polyporus brumalis]
MPTYVYPASQRQRTHSQSYYPAAHSPQVVYTSSHHSSPGYHPTVAYAQPSAYYPSPQYLTPNYQHDSGRHHTSGHHRSGSGNVYYTASAPTHHSSSSRRSPSHHHHHHHTTTRRSTSVQPTHQRSSSRSHSVPRQASRDYSSGNRLRRSESRPRDTATYNVTSQRRGSHSSNEPLSERIRRMFGFGGQGSSANYRDHRADYRDPRTGRTVDWRGRPIYRV